MEGIVVLLVLGAIIGTVLGWVSFFKLRKLRADFENLERRINKQFEEEHATTDPQSAKSQKTAAFFRPASRTASPDSLVGQIAPKPQPAYEPARAMAFNPGDWKQYDAPERSVTSESAPAQQSFSPGLSSTVIAQLKDSWMIWLGGICVGLAGIFMVRYSIEQGLLDPTARIILSLLTGMILHGIAEWGRRRHVDFYQTFAALAGGASVTLYAAMLAALLLYELASPFVVFFGLMIVSLFTMALAVLHGPVLAIMGILGAYIVPLLVDTGTESILGLYVYCLIITMAAFLLLHYVYRYWLYGFTLLGAMAWWALSLGAPEADGFRGYYLVALAYLILARPNWDWLLRKPESLDLESGSGFAALKLSLASVPSLAGMLIVLIAAGISMLVNPVISGVLLEWTPLVLLLLVVSGSRLSTSRLPAALMLMLMVLWLLIGYPNGQGATASGFLPAEQLAYVRLAAWMVFFYSVFAYRNYRWGIQKDQPRERLFWFGTAIFLPLGWIIGCYLLLTGFEISYRWGAGTVALGLIYLSWAALRIQNIGSDKLMEASEDQRMMTAWLILAGHISYSVAVVFMTREAGITLALSAQLVLLTVLIKRFDLPQLDIYIKLVLAFVLARLTINPWLETYPDDVHWSLWTYGGSTLFCAIACWLSRPMEKLQRWLELASLHLVVLTLWAELRYWLYDGQVFAPRFELLEMSINMALWSCLSIVYYKRHQISEHLKRIYLLASYALLILAGAAYAAVMLPLNPLWSSVSIAATPIFNILLLSYGFPVLIAAVLRRFHDPQLHNMFATIFALSLFYFVTIEIRHLWNGTLELTAGIRSDEQYSYTVVWLAMAILLMLAGSLKFGQQIYRAGFGLIMLVIAKIFVVDMSDLEGLLRVASFMGLGLSLLGMAYLYQRFNLNPDKTGTKD